MPRSCWPARGPATRPTTCSRRLDSNREIGVALGILMSRHLITQAQAFDLLRMASQHTHRKLREIATEVAETGMLDYPPNGSA